jgi:hypothetical protein
VSAVGLLFEENKEMESAVRNNTLTVVFTRKQLYCSEGSQAVSARPSGKLEQG